jgi:hypothetical protein
MKHTHTPTLFGHRLRLARWRAELSQTGLAQRLVVGVDHIAALVFDRGLIQQADECVVYLPFVRVSG